MKIRKIYDIYINVELVKSWYVKFDMGYVIYADETEISEIYNKLEDANKELKKIIRAIKN